MPANPADLRRALNEIAMRQAGYFTSAQALRVGYSYPAQKYHVDHGNWSRVERGIYRLPDWPPQEEDVFVLWTLWSRGRAVVSHESALTLHNLGNVNPARVHLTVSPTFRSQPPAVLVLHRGILAKSDIEHRQSYQVTTVGRTLLDVAADQISQEQLQIALGEALERGLISPRKLRSRSDEFGDRAALRLERALGAEVG